MKSHVLIGLALVLILAACVPAPAATAPPTAAQAKTATAVDSEFPTSQPAEKTRQPSIMADSMHWETAGGGQITFDVTRNGQAYDVLVTSYQFKAREDRFVITAESGSVYEAISNVMQDQSGVGLHTSNEPRGSWTTLEFRGGAHSSTYRDVIVDRDLRIIYDYVAAQVERT